MCQYFRWMADCTLPCPGSHWSHFTYQGSRIAPRKSIFIHYFYTEHVLTLQQDLCRSTVCCSTFSLLGGHNSLIDRAEVLAAPGAVRTSNSRKREAFVPSSMQKLPLSSKKWFNRQLQFNSLHRNNSLFVVWTHKVHILESSEVCRRCIRYRIKTLYIVTEGWKKRLRLWRGREMRGGNQWSSERTGTFLEPLAFSRMPGNSANTIPSFHALGLSLLEHSPNAVGDRHKGQHCVWEVTGV